MWTKRPVGEFMNTRVYRGRVVPLVLVVASLACVLAWRVSRQSGPEGESLRALLMRLSGRAVKRRQPWTLPGLLAHGCF